MKKKALLGLLVFVFISCKKEENSPQTTEKEKFTQKVLIEKFTTTSCGNCGKADLDIDWFKNHYQQNVISVHYHQPTGLFGGDRMATQEGVNIASIFEVPGTPAAAINRLHVPNDTGNLIYIGGNWGTPIDNELKNTTPCGISLDATSITGNTLQVKAGVKFAQTVNSPLLITVLLLEDSVTGDTGYWQANYYDQEPNVPELFGRGHPIKNYVHNDVYRQALSPFWGQAIPAEATLEGKEHSIVFTADISPYRKNHLKIVAFVHGAGSFAQKHKYKILNAQEVAVGANQAF